MKKKVVTLLLSLTLVSGVMGCGSAEATNADVPQAQEQTQVQEQVQQTQEQEETQKEERQYDEYEYFFSTDELDLDNPDPLEIDNDKMSPNGEYCGDYILNDSVTLYTSRDNKTYEIGYTKPNIPVDCFNSSDDWICLKFDEESPNDFRLIKVSDFLANSNYSEQQTEENTDEIIANENENDNTIPENSIYYGITANEIRYFDKPFEGGRKIESENLKDVNISNRILIGGIAIQLYDENGKEVGILGIGDGITPKITKQDTKTGYLMIETDEGNFFVDGGVFNSNSYDPSEDSLITTDDFMEFFKSACEENGITIKDSKDGMTEMGTTFLTRKSRLSEANLKDIVKELKTYLELTEIYVENVVESGIQIEYDVYYK